MVLGMDRFAKEFGLINAEPVIRPIRSCCPDYTFWEIQVSDGMSDKGSDDLLRAAATQSVRMTETGSSRIIGSGIRAIGSVADPPCDGCREFSLNFTYSSLKWRA